MVTNLKKTVARSEFLWVKLLKDYFGLDNDIFIHLSYISPCLFQSKSNSDSLDAIIRYINILKNIGTIVICGDLNARSGIESDNISNVSDKHVPLNPDILQRNSEDIKVDDRGKQVNVLCIFTRMRILNVRILGDSFGIFTCQKSTGAIVVDYMIASEEFKIIFFPCASIPAFAFGLP